MRNFLILVFVLKCFIVFSQKFGSRSGYEKRWAFAHPFAALKVKRIYRQCMPYYEEIKKINAPDNFENGGKLDAFRHCFFMAAFAQKIKTKKIRKLGKAHEKGNYKNFLRGIIEEGELADSLSTVMDLHNNELGFRIGKNNRTKDLKQLRDLVIEEIKKGEAIYFKRNNSGQYLDCNNEVIDLNDYKTKWSIPKCLITTNN